MHLWIDLANSPHVPFFRALQRRFVALGHTIEFSAREFAETVPLANQAGLSPAVIGGFGGREVSAKAGNLATRAWQLAAWARSRKFDLAVSHNSYSQIVASRALRIRNATLMDYEYQPANHLAFRLSSRVIVPASFPHEQLRRFGAREGKVRQYGGTKEDVYLADFEPDPSFNLVLKDLGVAADDVLILMRPPAHDALYHRFQNTLFDEVLDELLTRAGVCVVLLPRNETQRDVYTSRKNSNLIVPGKPLDGPNLLAASDLVISAGGTLNREAAALGVPAISVYAGKWAAVDEQLAKEGRLKHLSNLEQIREMPLKKKTNLDLRRSTTVIDEVVSLILE